MEGSMAEAAPTEVYVSITEMLDFLRCRRAWDYLSPIRQALTQRRAPQTQFHTGSLVHAGVEAITLGQDPFNHMSELREQERLKLELNYLDQAGHTMSSGEALRLNESYTMAEALVRHYARRYGDDPFTHEGTRWKCIASEFSGKIPTGIRDKLGREVCIVFTIDNIASDADDPERIAVVERKTYGQKPDISHLKTDHQQIGYVACLQQLIRQRVAGCLYDGVMKRVPQPPKLLQNGDFSQAVETTVSYWSYLD